MKLVSNHRRSPVVSLLAAAVLVGSVACGAPKGGEDVASGSLQSAITAVGPDGATYALPAGTTLTLVGGATYSFAVDGTGSSASYSLPAGTYSATLSTVTQLERTGDAGPVTAVSATLTDAQPYEITIVAGQTTDLTFHFSLAGGETITFATGTVSTTVAVSFDAGAANGVGSTFQLVLGTAGVGSGVGAISGAVTFQTTGPFVPAVGDVCAPIGKPTLANGSLDQAWFLLEGASQSGNGSICFAGGADASGTYPDPVSGVTVGTWSGSFAIMYADAAPTWATIDSANSGSAAYLYQGTLSTAVFDGTTLNLSQLVGPSASNGSSFTQNGGSWSELNGTATLQLLP